jgi:hypothetical protein
MFWSAALRPMPLASLSMTFAFSSGTVANRGFAVFTLSIGSAALRPKPLALLRGVLRCAPVEVFLSQAGLVAALLSA